MGDARPIGSSRLRLIDEADRAKELAGSLWMATHYLSGDDRMLIALAALVEDQVAAVAKAMRDVFGADQAEGRADG